MFKVHLLKPDGDRKESLALRRGPATQVTKAKKDIRLKQGNHLPHNGVLRGCHAQPPRNKQVSEEQILQSLPTPFFTGTVSTPSQHVAPLLQPQLQPRCNECCFGEWDPNVNSQPSCHQVSRQQGQMSTQRSGEFSGAYEHSPATILQGPSSLRCP